MRDPVRSFIILGVCGLSAMNCARAAQKLGGADVSEKKEPVTVVLSTTDGQREAGERVISDAKAWEEFLDSLPKKTRAELAKTEIDFKKETVAVMSIGPQTLAFIDPARSFLVKKDDTLAIRYLVVSGDLVSPAPRHPTLVIKFPKPDKQVVFERKRISEGG